MSSINYYEYYLEFYKTTGAKYDQELKSFYERLKIIIEDHKYKLDKAEEKIKAVSSNKTNLVKAYKNFLSYLNKKLKENNLPVYSSMLPKTYETDVRRIELIKFLQENKTRYEILDEFMISERTLNSDFAALENGIDFAGTKIKINFDKYNHSGLTSIDGESYHSSCNPIALPLNMTELYLLSNVIPNALKNYELRHSYERIIRKIYPQLTDYALNLIGRPNFDYNDFTFDFEYESIKNSGIDKLIYAEKRTIRDDKNFHGLTFILGGGKEITGNLIELKDEYFIVKDDQDNEIKIYYDDFVDIKDFYKKYS